MCNVHVTLGAGVLIIASIVYGLLLFLKDITHHATPVIPHHNNGSQNDSLANENFLKTHENSTLLTLLFNASKVDNDSLSVSAYPTPVKKDVPPQCADPTFACQDLVNARVCGVVKTCIHDIWSTMSVPDDNDEICDICKEMVKEARDQLLSNMTQEEIKEVFEGSCKLLPVKLVSDACIKLVDEFIPQLVEMLASRMDPNMVCTVSGMCFVSHTASENTFMKLLRMILLRGKDDQCTQCTTMLTDVQTFLKSTPENDVKKYIENFCDQKMPSYICDMIVNEYFSSLYSYVVSTDAKVLCSSVGICPKTCDAANTQRINDELTCEFCDHVLHHIKDLMTANTTVEEFRTALLNFCNHTGTFSEKCTSLVNDYYDMLFDYIRNLDTKGMCTLIGLCNNEMCNQMPMVKLIPAEEATKRIPMMKLQPATRVVPVVRDVYPMVRLVPADVASKKHMVESNDIFQPQQLPMDRLLPSNSIFERDTECAFCKAISFYIQQDLQGDLSKEAVRTALDNVCSKWVPDFPSHCKTFVAKHSKKIRYSLAEGVEFDQICVDSKICPVEEDKKSELKVRVLPSFKKEAKNGEICDICKDLFNKVEDVLSDPDTKNQIENLVDQACSLCPVKDDCVSFLNSNVDAAIDILQQELNPDNICPALHLCDASKRVQVSQRVKDLECDVCKDVVTSFRQKLSDPGAKTIVLTFLEEGCARLPGSLAQDCKTFVDENIDTVLAMIISELDPDTVCSILRICPSSLRTKEPKKYNDEQCDVCKVVIGNFEAFIKDDKTEASIQQALDKVCSYLPASASAKCSFLVDQYTKTFITLFIQEMDPNLVCAALNVCPASLKLVVLDKPKKVNDVECDLCKEVVQKVEDMITDKKTEAEIKQALDKVCDYLPSSMAAKCTDFVNTYLETLITLIMQELDPSTVCAEMNACPQSLKLKIPKVPKKVKDLECDVCKEVVKKVEDMISDAKTEEEITQALDKVCSYLPSSMAEKCTNFVNSYLTMLINLLMQEMDPDMVCAELNVCPAQDMECQSCQYALHYVQEQLNDPATQDELKNLLKSFCGVLPESLSNNCEAFVNEYGSSLLVLLAQEIDPSKLCFEFQMCSNQTKIFVTSTNMLHPFSTDECSVCTTIVDYIDKLLEEDDVDKEITKLVEKVCPVLPISYVDKCTTMLDTYGPYLLQMIGQLANSKEVCQEIDLCSRPAGHVHLVGGNKCTFGPSYWCKSPTHASACKAEMYCKQKAWKN